MANKNIIAFTTIAIIIFSFILTVPITIISFGLSSYDIIHESISYEYAPQSSSSIEQLNINADIGNIEIMYIDPPVNYFAKINVNIEMAGSGLAGKNYDDYFNITEGDITSMPVNFSITLFSNITKAVADSLIKDVSIIVTLRKGIIFDIMVKAEESNVDLLVPFGVSVNNIIVNVTNGEILYEFNQCTIGGNITGIIYGDVDNLLEIQSYNVQYTRNSVWFFTIEQGDLNLNISQYEELGANVTGNVVMDDGDLIFSYNDNSANVGARFALPWENGNTNILPRCVGSIYIPCQFYGFQNNTPNLGLDEGILILTSIDLLENRVSYIYNLTLELLQGTSKMELLSVN